MYLYHSIVLTQYCYERSDLSSPSRFLECRTGANSGAFAGVESKAREGRLKNHPMTGHEDACARGFLLFFSPYLHCAHGDGNDEAIAEHTRKIYDF